MRFVAIVLMLVAAACSSEVAVPSTTTPAISQSTVTRSPVVDVTSIVPPATTRPRVTTTVTALPPAIGSPQEGREAWFVVWVTGQLPDGFGAALRALPGVGSVSVVRVGNAHVVKTRDGAGTVVDRTADGFVIPVELQAIDPNGHREFAPVPVAAQFDALEPGEVILGSSSARLRNLGVGSSIKVEDGTVLRVVGVVDDRWVGSAEMVTTRPDSDTLGTERDRYAVVRFDGTRDQLAGRVAGVTDLAFRVWGEQDVPVLRHADGVQAQVMIKLTFGEFSYRPGSGQRVEIDPEWVAENIVTVDLPLIGPMRCHRVFAEMLRNVMETLEALGERAIITRASNIGCWNARFIAGRRDLSRHAWGVAADINWGNRKDSVRSPVAPVLLESMAAAGLTSGHAWVNPDPGHFEWVGDGT